MTDLLYIYDFIRSRTTNARRVAFTKELYGYTYSWRTKAGIKQRRKAGLLEECEGAHIIAESTIFVPSQYKNLFDELFDRFQDIMHLHVYEVVREI